MVAPAQGDGRTFPPTWPIGPFGTPSHLLVPAQGDERAFPPTWPIGPSGTPSPLLVPAQGDERASPPVRPIEPSDGSSSGRVLGPGTTGPWPVSPRDRAASGRTALVPTHGDHPGARLTTGTSTGRSATRRAGRRRPSSGTSAVGPHPAVRSWVQTSRHPRPPSAPSLPAPSLCAPLSLPLSPWLLSLSPRPGGRCQAPRP